MLEGEEGEQARLEHRVDLRCEEVDVALGVCVVRDREGLERCPRRAVRGARHLHEVYVRVSSD